MAVTGRERLLLAIAFIPQTILPYELVALALIPANLLEMGLFVAGAGLLWPWRSGCMLTHSIAERGHGELAGNTLRRLSPHALSGAPPGQR